MPDAGFSNSDTDLASKVSPPSGASGAASMGRGRSSGSVACEPGGAAPSPKVFQSTTVSTGAGIRP